jgi:hypothetical protein
MPCLQEEGRPELPSLLEAVKNSSVESSVMARSEVASLLQDEPMKVVGTEVVSNELKAPKANGLTEGEATARQAFTVSGDGEHR